MFRQRLNSLSICLLLHPLDPLLVKADPEQAKGQGADMEFVRTWRNRRWEPYLPGSSLKGVLRTRAEQFARALNPYDKGACETFGSRACSEREEWKRQRPPGSQAYADACPICKLFGHAYLAARLRFSDACLIDRTVITMAKRDGVGIDRKRGASAVIKKDDGSESGAKYDYEVWDGAPFETRLDLINFELWQVGLLAYLLDDLERGAVRVGYGTRRGLGRVRGEVKECTVTYFGARLSSQHDQTFVLRGVAGLVHQKTADKLSDQWRDYRLWPEPASPLVIPARQKPAALWTAWVLDKAGRDRLWEETARLWDDFIVTYGAPEPPLPSQEASHA